MSIKYLPVRKSKKIKKSTKKKGIWGRENSYRTRAPGWRIGASPETGVVLNNE